jgi:hypothetical protein
MRKKIGRLRGMSQVTYRPAELSGHVLDKGLDVEAFRRLHFRLFHVEECLFNQSKALQAGNIASYEPEFYKMAATVGDLANTIREFLTLFQQEQGLISPPNAPKAAEETGGP